MVDGDQGNETYTYKKQEKRRIHIGIVEDLSWSDKNDFVFRGETIKGSHM